MEPIEPNSRQLANTLRWGWSYDIESFMFEKDGMIGFFTELGFYKI